VKKYEEGNLKDLIGKTCTYFAKRCYHFLLTFEHYIDKKV